MKTKNKIYLKTFLFDVYLVVLRSYDLVVCIALQVSSNLSFFWAFLQGVVHQLLKWGALECNHAAIRNSGAYSFFFVEPDSKTGKSVYQQWFLCKLTWFLHCGFLFIGDFYLSERPCRTAESRQHNAESCRNY